MDDKRFDEISRFLGTSVSRQSVFKLLAGFGAAGASAIGGLELIEAKKRKNNGKNGNDKDKDGGGDANAEGKKGKGKGKGKGKNKKGKGKNQEQAGAEAACNSPKVLICHNTGSGSNPYTSNCISTNAACNAGHGFHPGDCACGSSVSCTGPNIPSCSSIGVSCSKSDTTCGTPRTTTTEPPHTTTTRPPHTTTTPPPHTTTTEPPPTTTTPPPPTTTTSPLVCAGECKVGDNANYCPDIQDCRCKLTDGNHGECITCPEDRKCGPYVCCRNGDVCTDPQSGICSPPTTTTPPPTTTTPPPTTTTAPPTTTTAPPTTTTAPPTTTTAPPTTTTAPPTTTTQPPCVPKICTDLAGQCGQLSDGCGGFVSCNCESGQICSAATNGVCTTTPGCVPESFEVACAGLACGPASNGCGVDYECGLCGKKKGKNGRRDQKQVCVTGVCKATGKKRCVGGGLAGQACGGKKCKCASGRRCNNGKCCEPTGDGSVHCNANSDCCPGLECARRRPGQHKVCIRKNAKAEDEATSTPSLAIGALLTGLALKGGERWFGTAGSNAPIALTELGNQNGDREV